MQRIVAVRTQMQGIGTNLHPGDIAHRIYNGLRREDPARVVPIWEDESGIAAYALLWPKHGSFDLVTRLDLPDHEVRALVEELTQTAGTGSGVETDVIGKHAPLIPILESVGYSSVEDGYAFTGRRLPAPGAADGEFVIRSVAIDDAPGLAAVHASAFGSEWTPQMYAALMSTPGYSADRELVAVAPDGSFAGFAVTWYDDLNRVGLFEPVGVAQGYQRRGVGRLLLNEGMRRMHDAGMSTATVWHSLADQRAASFYRASGFERLNVVSRWTFRRPT